MFKRLFNFDERSTRKLVAELESSKDHAQVEILKSLAKDKGSEELVEPLKQTIKDLLQSSASDEVRRSAMQLIEDHSLLEPFLSKENLATTAAARIIALVGADQAHPIMADPRVINARITSAAAADVDGLIAHATSLEQLCQLAH